MLVLLHRCRYTFSVIADLEHPRELVHQPFFARVLAHDQRLPLRDVDPPSKIGVRYVRLRDVVDMDGVNRFIEILGGHLVLCSHMRLRLAEQALRDEQQDRLATLDSIGELRLPLAPVSQPVVVPKWNVVMRKRFDQWGKTFGIFVAVAGEEVIRSFGGFYAKIGTLRNAMIMHISTWLNYAMRNK